MQVITTKPDMRAVVRGWRAEGLSVALVPTGADLHPGQLALVAQARQEADRVVAAILAKPAPHGPAEERGPDPGDRDLALLAEAGVDAVFKPEAGAFQDPGAQTIVETTELARGLLGKLRPGHFRAVATEINRLFNIVQPDVACFGDKDYQQLCVIRRMVRDLDMPVRIVGVPCQRDADGLALSARNARLSAEDRAAALVLSQALFAAEEMARSGITASRLRAWVAATIQAEPRADLQSADIRDAGTLAPISGPLQRPAVILLAVRFGKVLLIDQRVVCP